MKLLGILVIVVAASAAGFGFAAEVRAQIRQLTALITALDYMKSEMECNLTPLPQLFAALGQQGERTIAALFARCGDAMLGNASLPPQQALRDALTQTRGLRLSGQTRQSLESLGLSLGKFDLGGQSRAVDLAKARLQAELDTLLAGSRARCRSYETIGICAGLALAVILL